jgi:hypothetical protein
MKKKLDKEMDGVVEKDNVKRKKLSSRLRGGLSLLFSSRSSRLDLLTVMTARMDAVRAPWVTRKSSHPD